MFNHLVENVEMVTFAGVAIPLLVQSVKANSNIDPRAINALISTLFAVFAMLIEISINDVTFGDFLSGFWGYALGAWTLATMFYKLAHKSKS